MMEQNIKTVALEYRKVYLSDLNAVINIYKKLHLEPTAKGFPVDFGLPLSVATQHKEIVGFTAASVNEFDEPELHSYCTKAFDNTYTKSGLEEQAKNALHATFGTTGPDCKLLKRSIDQLTAWLSKHAA